MSEDITTVKVREFNKNEYSIELPTLTPTVGDLRIGVGKFKNFDPIDCQLIYAGIVLKDDGKKLADYKITKDSRVILLVKKGAKEKIEVKQPEKEEVKEEEVKEEEVKEDVEDDEIPDLEGEYEGEVVRLREMAQNNPQEFAQVMMQNLSQLILGGFGNVDFIPADEAPEMPMYRNVGGLGISEEDKVNVNQIIELTNAPYSVALQYYIATNKDKEASINMIYNDM
jgi:hypothetical protein